MVRTFFPPHAGKPHAFHQSRDGASDHAEAFPLQLVPDLTNSIDTVVFVVHALYLQLQLVITPVTLTAFFRMLTLVLVPVVCRRGDIQLMAYRSDSVTYAEGIEQRHHVHMCISIPPKYSVSTIVGYLKGKSAIAIARQFGRGKNFTGEVFWARGYFVSTVGLDEATVRAYIRKQEREDERYDKMNLNV